MTVFIVIANRLIKLMGIFVKTFGYLFHAVFPKKRFTIPFYSKPLISSNTSSNIPRTIWQTNFTNRVTLPVYMNYLFNRLMSLRWEYRYVSTEDRLEFIKAHAPSRLTNAYEQLTDGASQADLWRLVVLNYHGGVYMDIDAHCVWPLSLMVKPEYNELFLLNKEHFTNYFIASSPNNIYLQKALDIIVDNIEQKRIDGGVYALTGPVVLNLAIGDDKVNHRFYRITCNQGSFTNEHFQYIDKPRGKWTYADKDTLLRK